MTLEFVVSCLLLIVVWLGVVPLFTGDRVQVADRSVFKALIVMFGFWLLSQILREVFDPLAPHPVWAPFGRSGADVSGWIFSILIGGLAIWLIGRLRHFRLLLVDHYGWAAVASSIVLFSSHLIDRFALPILMPHVYHVVAYLR